jgi:hypothetical protein
LWFLPLAFSSEFINRGPKLASLPRPQISCSTGGPRPGAQPPLEALFNLALELSITSSPSGSSPEALRWPARLTLRQYGEHIELLPLRARCSAPRGRRRAVELEPEHWIAFSYMLLGPFMHILWHVLQILGFLGQ